MAESISLTREQLYEAVWSTPIDRLAPRYGVSGVALAKTCRRMGIPTPPRGFRAKLAAGDKPKRAPLPEVKSDQRTVATFRDRDNSTPKAPSIAVPDVPIPTSLASAHDGVSTLVEALKSANVDEHQRLRVAGPNGALLLITIGTHRRALLLLAGLARALTVRGHEFVVERHNDRPYPYWTLQLAVQGERFDVSVTEKMDRQEHVMTAVEKSSAFPYGIQKYDYTPNGRLEIVVRKSTYGSQQAVSDTPKSPIDDRLGRLILAAEQFVRERAAEKANAERQRIEQQRLELERRRAAALAHHREALEKDLHAMAGRWHQAVQLRAFVTAVQEALPPPERDDEERAWIDWATDYVARLDPLTMVHDVAKSVVPDER